MEKNNAKLRRCMVVRAMPWDVRYVSEWVRKKRTRVKLMVCRIADVIELDELLNQV